MHTDKLIEFFFGMCAIVIARVAEAEYAGLLGFELMVVCVWVGNLYMVFEMRFWDLARILWLVWKGCCCRMWEMKLVLVCGENVFRCCDAGSWKKRGWILNWCVEM